MLLLCHTYMIRRFIQVFDHCFICSLFFMFCVGLAGHASSLAQNSTTRCKKRLVMDLKQQSTRRCVKTVRCVKPGARCEVLFKPTRKENWDRGQNKHFLPHYNSFLYVHPKITAGAVMFICMNINPYRIIGNDSLND